jgi:threonine dehydrogenase-like Zn-dependent dehydrogenase
MKGLIFHKPKEVSVGTINHPIIRDPSDAIVPVTITAICG